MNNWKKVFGIIWTGQLFSYLSSSIVSFSAILWLSFETQSAEVLATATLFALLPQSILGLFSGVFVDRWNRKRVMMLSDSFIAICSLGLAILFFTGKVNVGYIYALLAFRSAGSAFHAPAMQASIPLLAPENKLGRIAGINQMIMSVSNIAGPALGALFITIFDMGFIMLIDVLGAIIAVGTLVFVTIPNPKRKEKTETPHVFREIKEGLSEIAKTDGLALLFLFSIIVTFFIMPVSALFPLMTLNHFSGNAFQMSLIEVIWGIGMLLGGAFLGMIDIKSNRIGLINAMYIVLGLTFLLSGILPQSNLGYWLFVVLTAIGGFSGAIFNSMFSVVIQINIKPEALGRVFSMLGSMMILPSLIGLSVTGIIADEIGLTITFIIAGIAICCCGLISFFVPKVMKIDRTKPKYAEN